MLREYAVEPVLLSNWQDFRYFVEKFGISQGRLISRYPSKWKKLVYDSLNGCGEIDRKRIEEALTRIDDRLFRRAGSDSKWDPSRDWLFNADMEHSRRPFHAIVAKRNPNGKSYILEGDSLSDSNPVWCVSRCCIIARQAKAMADCVKPLLNLSKTIIFVDAHFSPSEERFRITFEQFLEAALETHVERQKIIEYHLLYKESFNHFEMNCNRRLQQIIPKTMHVKFVRWQQRVSGEKFHNRFILTDLGGVSFGVGLDEGDIGQTDEVQWLDETAAMHRKQQYMFGSTAFDFVDELTIYGAKLVS